MRLSDTLLAAIFLALAAAIFAMTTTFPAFPGQKYGPDLFPRILAAGIAGCCLLIMLRAHGRARAGHAEHWLTIDAALRDPKRLISFLLVPGGIVFYLVAADRLGFIPTAFLLLMGLFIWFGVRLGMALAVAVVATGLMQWFFGTLMRVPLPRGLFMQLLYGG